MPPVTQPSAEVWFAPNSDSAHFIRQTIKRSAQARYGMTLRYAWPAVADDNLTCMVTIDDHEDRKHSTALNVYTLRYVALAKRKDFFGLEVPVIKRELIQLCKNCLEKIVDAGTPNIRGIGNRKYRIEPAAETQPPRRL